MSGLELMMQRMQADASEQAAQIAAGARAEAEQLLSDAAAAGQEKSAEIAEQSERDVRAHAARVESALAQQRRTALLAEKQKIIAELLEKSCEALRQKPAEEYFPYLLKVLDRYVQKGRGVLCLSKEDLARMPASFPEEAAKIAEAHGGTLTLSKEPRNISGGFLLIYGGIEENCTFSALFDARREVLQDQVHQMLFA